MDPEFSARHCTGVIRQRAETAKALLARATHVALQNCALRSLDGIEAATACHNLYAYDDKIASLGGLAPDLATHGTFGAMQLFEQNVECYELAVPLEQCHALQHYDALGHVQQQGRL
jgi:hypothetical protein